MDSWWIVWAMGFGLALLVIVRITGERSRSRLGTNKTSELEEKIRKLESRLEELERHKAV
jgi:hypothetical protein